MVGGYEELTPPSRFYRGPITGITRGYGPPYTSKWHCASCGSTDVSKPVSMGPIEDFRCNRCGRRTRIHWDPDYSDARYEIRKHGHVEMDSLTRSELSRALWDVLMDLDERYFSEKASEYYGRYYDELRDEARSGDVSYQEEATDLERDIPFVNMCMALDEGYVDGLDVREEYSLPDFPVSVVRVADAVSANRRAAKARRPTSSKPKTATKSVKAKASAKKKPAKAPARKAPVKKTSASKPKKPAKATSRRR